MPIKTNIVFSIHMRCVPVRLMEARVHGRPFYVTVIRERDVLSSAPVSSAH